jgi:ubiquinone/menaquinone biosynthesis C-methylase UbiE
MPQQDHLTRRNYVQRTAELYDGVADWYVESFWNDETDMDWVTICLGALEGKRSLVDVGSGPGNYARFFVDAGYDVTCTDVSAEMIRTATSRLPNIIGVVSDMRHMPFDNDSFDCVFCAYSLNHIMKADLRGTLREFGRILRPDGALCLMAKTGSDTYEFSNDADPASRALMCLVPADELQRIVQSVGISPTVVRYKDEASEREFQHQKMLIVGTKLR